MNHRGIRNPERFYESRRNQEKKRQRLLDSTFWNTIKIVREDHDGELKARNKVEALDILIRYGVFGASSKFPLRVSRHRKQEHHQNIAQAAPTEAPAGYQEWYALASKALELLEEDGTLIIEISEKSYVIRSALRPESSSIQKDLESQFGHVIETADPPDIDKEYNPYTRLNAHLLRSVHPDERLAYK